MASFGSGQPDRDKGEWHDAAAQGHCLQAPRLQPGSSPQLERNSSSKRNRAAAASGTPRAAISPAAPPAKGKPKSNPAAGLRFRSQMLTQWRRISRTHSHPIKEIVVCTAAATGTLETFIALVAPPPSLEACRGGSKERRGIGDCHEHFLEIYISYFVANKDAQRAVAESRGAAREGPGLENDRRSENVGLRSPIRLQAAPHS
jgi:hypothetical protein